MLKLLTIVGARPQFIKAAAISRMIRKDYKDSIEEKLIHTGQHYDTSMSDIFFSEMDIPEPNYNLGVGSGNHGEQTAKMISGLEEIFLKEKPNGVIVYGDTNSTLAAALAASKIHLPVFHIEAGLRSFNKSMPEELNRILTDHVSTLLFSPTKSGIENLKKEGLIHRELEFYSYNNPGIFHCGDIMYDNTLYFKNKSDKNSTLLNDLGIEKGDYILATIHRPSNTDFQEKIENIFKAFLSLVDELKTEIILPLHPRTATKIKEYPNSSIIDKVLANKEIHIIPAASYLDMMQLESNARLIITDSGGVQKEAWFLKKPVVILRNESEWIEIIEHKNGILTDSETSKIEEAVKHFFHHPPTDFPSIYGDGNAAAEIMKIVTSENWG